jgi:hypothetical protein
MEEIDNMMRILIKTHKAVQDLNQQVSGIKFFLFQGDDAPPTDGETNEKRESSEDNAIKDIDLESFKAKNITVGSSELAEILGVSEVTLKRWRCNKKLEFDYAHGNYVTYDLAHVYERFKSGKLKCRGLNSIDVMERLVTYVTNTCRLRDDD